MKLRSPATLIASLFCLCLQWQGQVLGATLIHPQDRITGDLSDNEKVSLRGNVHPLTLNAEAGPLQTGLPMERMVLVLQSDANQGVALDSLIQQQQDPKSPSYHHFLSPQQFASSFGVSRNDINKVKAWLTFHGFAIDEVPAGNRSIVFSGTSDQVAEAFSTEIKQYKVRGQVHYANATNPQIPLGLSGVVKGVMKLHDFQHSHSITQIHQLSGPKSNPNFTYGSSHYLSAADYATIYNIKPLYAQGIDGTGQSIAIVARSNIYASDVTQFRSEMGLPANPPSVLIVSTDPGVLQGDGVETTLDTEWSGAVAPKATIKVVVAASTSSADGVDLSAQYIVSHNIAPVVSVSYGSCEAYMGSAELSFYNSLWQQAAAQGITVFVSAGDSGAAGCNSGSASTGSVAGVNGLCSSPYSVCVGGTQFNEGSNPGQYWLPGNNTALGSVQSYVPEVVWNESGAGGGSGLWSGGGGASMFYAKPSWQTGPGVPADGRRDVPDVSLTAAGHDGYLIQYGGGLSSVGGTSASSPSFAGLMALVNQKTATTQGNPNTILYSMAAKQANGGVAIFHDITAGNNSVPGVTGFSAGPGYDMGSGLGSVDATQMVSHWSDFTTRAPALNLTVAQPALTLQAGNSVQDTLTVAVRGGFSAAVSLSIAGAPAGLTATLGSSNVAAPGSGNVAVTLSAASTIKAGTYNLTVTGQGATLTSSATIALTVSSPTLSLTASQPAVTLSAGQTASVTITAAPGADFNAAVALAVSGAPSGVTASLRSATLAAPGAGSTTLTLSPTTSAKAGSYVITVTGQGSGLTASTTVQLTITTPSLKLSASPAVLTLLLGQTGTVSVTSTVAGGFNAPVSFAVSGLPSGMTATVGTPKLAAPGAGMSVLTFSASKTLATGVYNITLTGQGGNLTSSAIVPVTVQSPGTFTFTPNTNYINIGQTDSATMLVTVAPSGGFNNPVTLSASGLPTGVTATYTNPRITATAATQSTLAISVAKTTPTGVYNLGLVASGGGITKTIPLQLTVTAPSGCTLASNPASVTIVAGQSSTFQVTCGNVQGSYSQALNISMSGQPQSGVTIQMLKMYVVPGPQGGSTFAITSAQSAKPGTYMLSVNASVPAGLNQTITIPFTVTAPTALILTPSQQTVTLAAGGTTQVKITAVHSGAFNAAVTLGISGLPAGVTAAFSPATFNAPGDGTTTITLTARAGLAPVASYFVAFATGGGSSVNAVPVGLNITTTNVKSHTATHP